MAKRKAKKTNAAWTLEAEVLLLNWLDANKGADGALRRDEEITLNEFIAGDEFVRQHARIQDYPTEEEKRQHVQLRLRYLWNNFRSPLYAETPFAKTIIYTKGSAALDWNRLETRYRDFYTTEEYQARKASAGLATTTVGRPSNKRKSREGQDPENGTFESSAEDSTPKRLRPEGGQQPGQTILPSMSPVENNSGTESIQNHQPPQLPASIPPPLSGLERRARQDAMLSDLELAKLPKFKRLVGNGISDQINRPTDVMKLETQWMKMYTQVEQTVEAYVRSWGLDSLHPVVLAPESAYPRKLNHLVSLMLSGSMVRVEFRRETFQSLRDNTAITYSFFIRSLLIAATTEWCLRPHVEEARIYKSYGGGVIQQVLGSCVEPVVEARLRQQFLETYIEREIKPHIPSKAKDMATTFQGFVDLIMPRQNTPYPLYPVCDVKSCPRTDPIRPDMPAREFTLLEEPVDRINFREDLRNVFETALQWRAERDQTMFERYDISFPSLGDEYVASQMVEEEDSEGNKRARPVILCLLPVLFRSFSRRILGENERPKKVVSGIVL
ncbi:hypothetical protein CLCR_06970 [Cladophialophora carrionii]|uniref:Uncharacterized protein n=1 Tax=Cladophialophora carrionii TaxID=86049 RepID=A0A1C1CPP5_9EURO|nr:hypothetical protein CLCR_06970 [Cladophialophora carrionii]